MIRFSRSQLPLDSRYLFWNPRTKRRWLNIRKLIDAATKKSGLDWFRVKELRRHFAINLAERGMDMHGIQSLLWHSSVKTTDDYYAQFSPHYAPRRALELLKVHEPKNGRQTGGESDVPACA